MSSPIAVLAFLFVLAQAPSKGDPTVADELAKQFQEVLVPILLATVFLVVLLVGGLMLYFRRGDKAVQARLRGARHAGVQFPGPDDAAAPTDGLSEPPPAASEQPSPTPPS